MRNTVRDPEGLALWILLKRFPFMRRIIIPTQQVWDVRQIGWLAYYETGGEYRHFCRRVQRELYALVRANGFRRTRQNTWIVSEVHETRTMRHKII